MPDPRFQRTVVLLLDFDAGGALGVVVNRPTGHHLFDLVEGLPSSWSSQVGVYAGGPVEQERVVVLMRPRNRPEAPGVPGARPVVEGLYASRDTRSLEWAVEHLAPGELRVYVGYAGWGPGQLDQEVGGGHWHLVPALADEVFAPPGEALWERLIRRAVGTWVRTAPPGAVEGRARSVDDGGARPGGARPTRGVADPVAFRGPEVTQDPGDLLE
jgi:putative transcriptional regulator